MPTTSCRFRAFAERDGSFVNGERRVQRFYTRRRVRLGQALPAWKLFGGTAQQELGAGQLKPSAAAVMLDLSANINAFADISNTRSWQRSSESSLMWADAISITAAPLIPTQEGSVCRFLLRPTSAKAGGRVKLKDI